MDEGPQPLALFKANRQSKCEFGALPFFRSRALDQASRNNWTPYVQVDGKLVTGQNPASSGSGAEELLKLLRSV